MRTDIIGRNLNGMHAFTTDSITEVVRRLRKQGADDAQFEAKSCKTDLSTDVWESVSAFANTDGGTLLLGLDESRNFAVHPQWNLDRVRDQFIEGIGDGGVSGARLTNAPHYSLYRVDLEGSQILAIRIARNDPLHQPCYITSRGIQSGSYKRIDDKDVRLSAPEIYEMQNALSPGYADRQTVPETTINDLDPQLIESLLIRRANSKSLRGTIDQNSKLIRLNVLSATGETRLAGLLTCGQYPQQFFPKLVIDVAVHQGTEKSLSNTPRFVDRQICDGSMGEAINEAVNTVARNLRTASIIQGTARIDEPEIPREVLRELIANAVVHREYQSYFLGQAISVDVFSDRILITSPGGLWGGKTIATLADGTSRCRNMTLMQLMQEIPASNGGVSVEAQGSGIAMVIREMRERGLPVPEFKATADQFTVLIPRANSPQTMQRTMITRAFTPTTGTGDSVTEQTSTRQRHKIAILDIMHGTDTPITMKTLMARSGYSYGVVYAALHELLNEGLIIATAPPRSRNRKYALADNQASDSI